MDGGSTGGREAMDPSALKREFWRLVTVVNVGVLGTSLGVMLLAFTDRTRTGVLLAIGGLAVLAYAAVRYRSVRPT